MGKILVSGLIAGTAAGLLLFLACAYVELITGIELMTLLLNIDFIYDGGIHIILELLLHLLVSILLASVLKWFYHHKFKLYMPAMVVVWSAASVLYFVLSSLANQPLELNSYIGLTVWMIFHIGYLEVLHLCYRSGL